TLKKTVIPTRRLDDPEFRALPKSVRCDWLMLQGLCARRGNGGIIEGAQTWGASQWSMVLPGRRPLRALADVLSQGLARWTEAGLEVLDYDIESENTYRARLVGSELGGSVTASAYSRCTQGV